MLRFALSLLLLCASAAHAEEVVLGLIRDNVSISTSFNGDEILIFGAIKRQEPIPDDAPIQVIITVAGPDQTLTVRRKEKRFGIWVNTEAVEIDAVPSFYSVATSAPLSQAISDTEDLRYQVSIPRAIRSVGAPMTIENAQAFSEAVIRIRENNGAYQLRENTVALNQSTLFHTAIRMPADLTEGLYPTRIFLTRDGQVLDMYETGIDVRKVGLERWLYTLSRQHPLLYGLMSLAIAIAAGWGASTAFRLMRSG